MLKSLFINKLSVQCTVDLKILSLAIVRARLPRNEATRWEVPFALILLYFFMKKQSINDDLFLNCNKNM